MRRFVCLICAGLTAIACVLTARTASAVQVQFQMVGPNSLLANPYIVDLGNLPMEAQDVAGASLTTTYSGTITVDVDNILSPTSIAFISANAAAANSGSWLPQVGGGDVGDPDVQGDANPGTPMPGNYGFVISIDFGSGPATLYIASRDTVLSLDTVVAGAKPITGGQFDPFGIGISVPQGTYDANLSDPGYFGGDAVTGSDPLIDEDVVANCTDAAGTANRCGSAMGSYAVSGGTITLTLPIDFLLGGGAPEINFTGTFTATAVIGDYSNNSKADAADYVLWRNDPNAYGGDPAGYNTWRGNFGNPPSGTGQGGAVPEPASAVLVVLGLIGLSLARRR